MSATKNLVLAAGVLAFVATATPSHAFRMIQNTSVGRVSAGAAVPCNSAGGFAHWNIRNISWYHNTANKGAGKAAALQGALAAWTAVTSADHNLTYAGTTASGFSTDGRNTFVWANGNGCTGSCLAITALVLQAGQVIVETDVSFNNSVNWTTTGAQYDTQSVATHEVGHALGIHHTEAGTAPTMYAFYTSSAARTLETDDRSALQCAESRY